MIEQESNPIERTTFIVKTLERPACLNALLDSIERYYPGRRVLVLDDGPSAAEQERVGHPRLDISYLLPGIYMPEDYVDIGLAAGRNILLDMVATEYFLLLDDDFVFTDETHIETLLAWLESGVADIAGGATRMRGILQHWQGWLSAEPPTLKLAHMRTGRAPAMLDIVQNFFVGRTEQIRKIRWDDNFKIAGEHVDFFLRCKAEGVRVVYVPTVVIDHDRKVSGKYNGYRARGVHYRQMMCEKWGFTSIVGSLTNYDGDNVIWTAG